MNYQKHYDLIISTRLKLQEERAQLRKLRYKQEVKNRTHDTYFEKHHIIPKCLNGTNDKSNLILLTTREHYIAHWLLAKIYPTSNLVYALKRLSHDRQNNHVKHNSRKYELLKIEYFKLNSGKNHPGYGKTPYNKNISMLETFGKDKSNEIKSKISNTLTGRTICPTIVEKIAVKNRGKTRTKIQRARMSQAQIGDKSAMWGLNPWDSNRIKNNTVYLNIWAQLDKIYNIWILLPTSRNGSKSLVKNT